MHVQLGKEPLEKRASFRFDARTHQLLMGGHKPFPLDPRGTPLYLPEPVFPRFPEKAGDVEPDPKSLPRDGTPYRTRVTPFMIRRALRGWLYPYIKSRVLPGNFHPIIAYLFIEWKCNLAYCYSAGRAIKWTLKQEMHGFQGTTGGFED